MINLKAISEKDFKAAKSNSVGNSRAWDNTLRLKLLSLIKENKGSFQEILLNDLKPFYNGISKKDFCHISKTFIISLLKNKHGNNNKDAMSGYVSSYTNDKNEQIIQFKII